MNPNSNLKQQALEEMDVLYLKAVQACKKWKRYDWIKRWEAAYKLHRLREKFSHPRLNGQGGFGGIMLIGINPSIRSKLGNIWEDPYGVYLAGALEEAGISPAGIYITNLYKYPTPENRSLTQEEITSGKEELELEILMTSPSVIATLGAQPREVLEGSFEIFPIDHPSYVKRFPEKRSAWVQKLKEIKNHHDKKRIRREPVEKGDEGSRGTGKRSPEGGSEKRSSSVQSSLP